MANTINLSLMKNYLSFVRFPNLVLLALMQVVLRYGFLKLNTLFLALSDVQFGLLVLSTVLLAAAGYVINDIFDQEADSVNRPTSHHIGRTISETNAYTVYVVLNCLGVGIGFYLSRVIERPGFVALFILVAALLYFYATTLKQILLLGNLVVAGLLSFSILIVGFFDIYPATYDGNQQLMSNLFSILVDYSIFAFILGLYRELVKDLEDIEGDILQGKQTLPQLLGVSIATKLIFVLGLIPQVLLVYYINKYFIAFDLYPAALFGLFAVVGPLLYVSIKLFSAQTKADFTHISNCLKWVILAGIGFIAVVSLNIYSLHA
jgi:4-hydroxybenzoate polyprenyltransferase